MSHSSTHGSSSRAAYTAAAIDDTALPPYPEWTTATATATAASTSAGTTSAPGSVGDVKSVAETTSAPSIADDVRKLRQTQPTILGPEDAMYTTIPVDQLDYSRDRHGNIVCTDPTLQDPSAFAAFIQHHGAKPPILQLRIQGGHWEQRESTTYTTDSNGVRRPSSQSTRQHVTDFDYSIPLTHEILIKRNKDSRPFFFTYLPEVATYRGTSFKRTQQPQDEDERVERGLSSGQQAILAYLASTAPLKTFRFEKLVRGWDVAHLQRQIEMIIRGTGYFGDVTVSFVEHEKYIYIRPGTRFSNWYHNIWWRLLRWLLFPIGILLWLMKKFWLGADWHVLGARFDLYAVNERGDERGLAPDAFLLLFHKQIAGYAEVRKMGDVIPWPGADGHVQEELFMGTPGVVYPENIQFEPL